MLEITSYSFLGYLFITAVGACAGIIGAVFVLRFLDRSKMEVRTRRKRRAKQGKRKEVVAGNLNTKDPTLRPGATRTQFSGPGPAHQRREPSPEPERDPARTPVG